MAGVFWDKVAAGSGVWLVYSRTKANVQSQIARPLALGASQVKRDALVASNETGGFKYIPGGREYWIRLCNLVVADLDHW